ncbi:MAG: gsiA 1 [Aeromicrobium sp.]|nr:gsiA 1 [Aeromicrobium sp.]
MSLIFPADALAPGDSSIPLLRVEDLHVAYRSGGSDVAAVRGVDVTVDAGRIVALVGESGSGKSTTAHAVNGMLPAAGRVSGGRILYRGLDLTTISAKDFRGLRGRSIGLVPQDPGTSLNPVARIGAQVAEPLIIHGLANRRDVDRQVHELLERVGIDRPDVRARQFPHQLSGGLKQRVLIAIALAARPRLIIADEPTSALDVTVQRTVLDHVDELVRELGVAILLITHDLAVAAERADTVVVLKDGEVVESGTPEQVLEHPAHDYTRRLVADAPSLSGARRLARSAAPEPLLEVSGLRRTFRVGGDTIKAVDDVSFALGRGRTLGLLGESGSGKSTTARIVVGLEQADAGSVLVDGRDVTAMGRKDMRELRRSVQIIYQNPVSSLDPRYTVGRAIEEPLRAFGIGDAAWRRLRVAELLDQVALPAAFAARHPHELSGGQGQRVAIARAIAVNPALLVCDEPVSALDVTVQAQILDLLTRLQDELGLSYLFISHDLAVIRQICDHVGVMRQGRLLELGTVDEIFDDPQDAYTQALLRAIPAPRQAPVATGRS